MPGMLFVLRQAIDCWLWFVAILLFCFVSRRITRGLLVKLLRGYIRPIIWKRKGKAGGEKKEARRFFRATPQDRTRYQRFHLRNRRESRVYKTRKPDFCMARWTEGSCCYLDNHNAGASGP